MRNYELLIDGEVFIARRSDAQHSQLRTVFDVLIYTGDVFGTADIALYNLAMSSSPRPESPTWADLNQPERSTTVSTKAQDGIFIKSGSSIQLLAGYDDDIGVIFTGTVTNVFRERDGTNIVTRLLCKAGLSANDTGIANSSYGAGATLYDVLVDLTRGWIKRLVINQERAEQFVFNSGYVADGDITRVINDLALAYGFTWTNANGRINVAFPDDKRDTPLYTISSSTGMIGIPELSGASDGTFLDVSNVINPHIDVNDRITVSTEYQTFNMANTYIRHIDAVASGEWNIRGMRYRGDNWGSSWRMDINCQRAAISNTSTGLGVVDTSGKLIYGKAVNEEFRVAVREVAAELGIDPNWLMATMAFETGGSFLPWQRNLAGGSAVGLIQFTPIGISDPHMRKYTLKGIARMSAPEQLRTAVKDYFKPYAGKMHNMGDVYMVILAPKLGVGKSDSTVLYTAPSAAYTQNARLDWNHKGYITRGDCMVEVNKAFMKGQQYAL